MIVGSAVYLPCSVSSRLPDPPGREIAGHRPDQEQRGGLAERASESEDRPREDPGRRVREDVAPHDLPSRGSDPVGGLADPAGTARSASIVMMIMNGITSTASVSPPEM